MRQCFRTASREAYSRAQPGYLQTNRCVLPVTKILPAVHCSNPVRRLRLVRAPRGALRARLRRDPHPIHRLLHDAHPANPTHSTARPPDDTPERHTASALSTD